MLIRKVNPSKHLKFLFWRKVLKRLSHYVPDLVDLSSNDFLAF